MNTELKKGKGLLPPSHDESRDFQYHVVFGSVPQNILPETDFFTGHPIKIKDQKNVNFCPLFAGSAVVEDQVGVELDPLSSYAWACKLIGAVQTNGMTLDDACKEIRKVGFIEQSLAPFNLETTDNAEFLANWENYSEDLIALAWEHARISSFRIDTGPHDIFDNIRSGLYQNVDEHRSGLTGAIWRDSWTDAPGGIIPEDYNPDEQGDGHAFKVFGQMNIQGKLYLVIQNSWGEEHGDKGIYYFPRNVVNAEFRFGAYNFKDLPPKKAEFLSQHGLHIDATCWQKIVAVVSKIITSYIKK